MEKGEGCFKKEKDALMEVDKEERVLNSPPRFGIDISVERKIYRSWLRNGEIRVFEKSGKGERSIVLALDQISWCVSSLRFLSSQTHGSRLNSGSISIFSRRNPHGLYLKIQVRQPEGFLFIPTGNNGSGAVEFADFLLRSFDMVKRGIDSSPQICSRKPASFLEAVISPSARKSSLEDRLYCLESEVASLQKQLQQQQSPILLAPMVSSSVPNSDRSMDLAMDEQFLRLEKECSPEMSSSEVILDFYSFSRTDIHASNLTFEEHCGDCSIDENYSSIPSEDSIDRVDASNFGFEETFHGCAVAFREATYGSNDGVDSLCEEIVENDDVDGEGISFEEQSGCGSQSNALGLRNGSVDAEDLHIPDLVDVQISLTVRDNDTVNNEMQSECSFSPQKNISSITENIIDGEQYSKDLCLDAIRWNEFQKSFEHTSGLMYNPSENEFFIWATEDPEDTRVFFFVFLNGKFILAFRGGLGNNNRQVLNELGWKRSFITENRRFHPTLFDLFWKKQLVVQSK